MATLVPIINLPNLYVNGCQLSTFGSQTLNISVGQVRDSTDTYDIVNNTIAAASCSFSGINGLDTGTVAPNTWYSVYLLFDPTNTLPVVTLLSTSSSAPVMPSKFNVTYSAFRLIGYVLTDGSSNFLPFDMTGTSNSRTNYWRTTIQVLSGGSAVTFSTVNCSLATPLLTTEVTLTVNYASPSAGSIVQLRPFSSTSAGLVTSINTQVSSTPSIQQVRVLSQVSGGVSGFQYTNGIAGSSTSIFVSDFKYFI